MTFELFFSERRQKWGMRWIEMGMIHFGTFEQAVQFAGPECFRVISAR